MPSLERRLTALRRLGEREAAAVLAEAVAGAAEDELGPISRFALRAARAPGAGAAGVRAVAAVVRRLDQQTDDTVRALIAGPSRFPAAALDRVIDGAVDSERGERERRNAIEVMTIRGEPRLCRRLPDLLVATGESREQDETAEAAATALRAVTVRTIGPAGRRHAPPAEQADLDDVLARAADDFRRHRLDEVLVAVALSEDRAGPALAAILADDDHPVVAALRGVPGRTGDAVVRRNLLRWLGSDGMLARPAARWIQALVGEAAYVDLLTDGHLLLAPARRRAVRQVVRPTRCVPPVDLLARLPERAQIGAALLLEGLDLSESVRVQRLAEVVAASSPAARRRAVLALSGRSARRAAPALAAFAFDRDPATARIALRGAWRDADEPTLARLADGGHAPLARRARRVLASGDASALRCWWPRLAPAERAAAAARLGARDPAALVAALGDLIAHATPPGAIAAVQIARRRRLVPEMEAPIVALAERDESRLASVAMAALADARGDRARAVLNAGLARANERVRANALEALGRAAPVEALRAAERCADGASPRTRANAIRVLLDHDRERGRAALRRMLGDADPRQRVSGIWLARAARGGDAAAELGRLADDDAIPEVRVRARAALRFLGREPLPVTVEGTT